MRAGIMPIMTYGGFKRMTSFCKTAIPADISETLEGIKDNDEAVKAFGIDLGVKMCRRLLEEVTPGIHMYTLNLEQAAVGILEALGLINKKQVELFASQSELRPPFQALGTVGPLRYTRIMRIALGTAIRHCACSDGGTQPPFLLRLPAAHGWCGCCCLSRISACNDSLQTSLGRCAAGASLSCQRWVS